MFLRKRAEKNEQKFFFLFLPLAIDRESSFDSISILQMKHCILIQNNQILGIDEKHFARIDDS